jgi:hypothetical protein
MIFREYRFRCQNFRFLSAVVAALLLHAFTFLLLILAPPKFIPFPEVSRIHLFSLQSPSVTPASKSDEFATQKLRDVLKTQSNFLENLKTQHATTHEMIQHGSLENRNTTVEYGSKLEHQENPSFSAPQAFGSDSGLDTSPLDTAPLTENYITRAVPLLNRPSVSLRAWRVLPDKSGRPAVLRNMVRLRKQSTSQLFEADLDSNGNPIQARFVKNGETIACSAKDINFMWYNMRGLRALWNYYSENGMLSEYAPQSRPLPDSLFGKPTMLRLKTGMVFIGTLEKLSEGSRMYVKLNIGGKYVDFYVRIIRSVEQAKRAG